MNDLSVPSRVRTGARRWPAVVARARVGDAGLAILIGLFVLSLPFVAHRMTASDAIEYYVYDRSLYFDHDLDFTNDYQGFYDRNPKALENFRVGFIEKRNPAGHAINNGPIGSAVLWSPFFLAGDGLARSLHALGASVAADGYSQPYIRLVSLGAAIYAGLALILTYLLARAIAGPAPAFWASLVVWLATPAIFYSHLAPLYAHATSWFAAAAFLTVWYRTRVRRTWRGWIGLGLLGGLVAMIREQDAVFLVVPAVDECIRLLSGLRRPDGAWWGDIARTTGGGVLMGVCALLAFTPQLAVYKALNGQFRPSTEVSDKLHWNAPNALRVLFDPAHGMFFWTPVLLFAIFGLALLLRRDPRLGCALGSGVVLTWYLNGSFQTWTTAGAFGARRFIVCSPIFAIGLAELIRRYGQRETPAGRRLLLWVPVIACVAIAWNAGLVIQFVRQYMDRQQLEWPLVFVNQFTTVPRHALGDLWRFVTDPGSFYQGGTS